VSAAITGFLRLL